MGFTVQNNSPSIGFIQWANLNMQYKGATYAIQDGYTNAIYSYWSPLYPNNLIVSNEFPTLGQDDCLIFLNKNGVATTVPTASVVPGDLIVPGTVMANAIAANAITGDKIYAGAISSDKIAANAIGADKIAANAITTSKLAAEVGQNLDISSNQSINLAVKSQRAGKIYNIRYIRDWANGSSSNTGNHWSEFKVIDNQGNNIAKGKTAFTCEFNNFYYSTNGSLAYLTDEVIDGSYTGVPAGVSSPQYIQLDLGQVYSNIENIIIWHYWGDNRSYYNTKTEVSEDGVNWYTLFDSAIEGEYAETRGGHNIAVNQSAGMRTSNAVFDEDGLTIQSDEAKTKTRIDTSSFRVEDLTGGKIAEFGAISDMPILTSNTITAENVYANNVVSKSLISKIIYVDGATGDDRNTGASTSKLKTVQKAIDMLEDVLSENISVYVYGSVPGFEVKNISGKGRLALYFDDGAVVGGNILVQGVTNQLNFGILTTAKKPTLKYGLSVYNCRCVDIYGINFDGKAPEDCNIYVENTNYAAVNACDIGGTSTSTLLCAIKVKSSLLWFFGCSGSYLTDCVGQYAFSTVMMARSGTSAVPDYTGGILVSYDANGRIQNWSGGTFTKTPTAGNKPAYVPSEKTQQWSFNEIWSDETLNGWSDKAELIQGYYSGWASGRWTGFMQMVDDFAAIRTAIAGATNLSGRIYVQRTTSTGNSLDSTLCLYGSDGTVITTSTLIDRGQGVWVTLSAAVVAKIQSGAIKYFYLKADTSNAATYFKCESNAKIELTYTK